MAYPGEGRGPATERSQLDPGLRRGTLSTVSGSSNGAPVAGRNIRSRLQYEADRLER